MSDDQIVVANAPEIPGLHFRHFRGENDYGAIAAVLTASEQADQHDRNVTEDDIATAFTRYISNCDLYADMIIAEVAGQMVGYARGWWTDELPSMRLYKHNGFILPAWRRKGIGSVMLNWMECRLREIAERHPPELEKYLQANTSKIQKSTASMLEGADYQPVRYFFLMVRPNLDDLPDFRLPDGLEVRPVTDDQYQAIWALSVETSQDEWGYTEPTEKDFQEWLAHPHFQPHLWQIAWDIENNQAVGSVLTYINHVENQQLGKKRGYTEGIGVDQRWRRRGVACALIALSLKAQKDAGMSESALIADSQSAFGVTHLYESCGFQIVNRDTIYRKLL